MLVVSDTSPISYLILIEEAHLLRTLYGEVVVPEAVYRELTHPSAPAALQHWSRSIPPWLRVAASPPAGALRETASFLRLDIGEQEAIALAKAEAAGLLIIDEQAGRSVARDLGLAITGTIGLLGAAVRAGHAASSDLVSKLRQTTFRASPDLYEWLRGQDPSGPAA